MDEQPREQLPPFRIHSRTGSVQFELKPPFFDGDTFATQRGEVRVLKKGFLMVEMANAGGQSDARGNTLYDWANKVSMKLSETDIQQMLAGLGGEACRIVHDPNKARGGGDGDLPKSVLQIEKGERYGYFMSMNRGERKARCPIGDNDAGTLRMLLERVVVGIYGW